MKIFHCNRSLCNLPMKSWRFFEIFRYYMDKNYSNIKIPEIIKIDFWHCYIYTCVYIIFLGKIITSMQQPSSYTTSAAVVPFLILMFLFHFQAIINLSVEFSQAFNNFPNLFIVMVWLLLDWNKPYHFPFESNEI